MKQQFDGYNRLKPHVLISDKRGFNRDFIGKTKTVISYCIPPKTFATLTERLRHPIWGHDQRLEGHCPSYLGPSGWRPPGKWRTPGCPLEVVAVAGRSHTQGTPIAH